MCCKLQRDAGVTIYSDGEFRRAFWLSAISDKFFHGFEDRGIDYSRYPLLRDKDMSDRREYVPQVPVVVDKLRPKGRVTGDEIAFLKKHAPGTFKMTVPSPIMLSTFQYQAGVSDRAYPTWKDFFDDFTRLMADEVKAIVDDGITYVQVDAPGYSRFIVPERRKAQLLDQGLDPKKELDVVINAENTLLRAAKREGVTVAVHICLGTYILGPQGPLGGGGSTYETTTIGEIIDRLEADTFLIEYSGRSGSLKSLRGVPQGKTISLGLINVRDPQVEALDDLAAQDRRSLQVRADRKPEHLPQLRVLRRVGGCLVRRRYPAAQARRSGRDRAQGLGVAVETLPGLERRLRAQLLGDVQFDAFTRGRYATDASHYQIMPLGVVAPRSVKEAEHAIALAREEGVAVTARGGGTSQCGQTINSSLIVDCSKYLDHVVELDAAQKRCVVEPGIVLDELNRRLKPHGLWFPVDISTASRATIGGMVGNNSCGARSLRYGNTRENVISVDALLADGRSAHFGEVAPDLSDIPDNSPLKPIARDLLALGTRDADLIKARFPQVQRRVGGYNLDEFLPAATSSTSRISWWARRARSASRPASSSSSRRCSAGARSAPCISAASTPRWIPRSTSSSSGRSRSSWSTAPCSGWRARSRCSSRPSTRWCTAIPKQFCSSSSPRTTGTRASAACCG